MRSDVETVAALQRVDEQVFGELVQQHQALMLRVASRRGTCATARWLDPPRR